MADASIVIPTYNGESYLAQLLEMIGRQKVRPAEVLAIDSGSTDSTLQILTAAGIRVHSIPNSEFSHPGTRNLGSSMVKSKYVVFVTQDATPADSCWLEMLLEAFDAHPQIAASYGRQIPRPGCNPLEAVDLYLNFAAKAQRREWPQDENRLKRDIWRAIHFSNASAAYNRELLLANPFDESLEMGEDQEWVKRMLQKEYSIAYQPESIVLHSHEHTLREKQDRSYHMGISFSQFLQPLLGPRRFPLPAWMVHVALDLKNIPHLDVRLATKLKWSALSPIHRAVTHYAYYRGWNSRLSHSVVDQPAKPDAVEFNQNSPSL